MSVGVLNQFLQTQGGGERSTVAYASALHQLTGDPVTIYCGQEVSIRELEKSFGIDLTGVDVCPSHEPLQMEHQVRAGKHELFVNHSYCSGFPNPAPFGLYSMMFPHHGPNDYFDTYDHILCNSQFTSLYTALKHPRVSDKVTVLYPPIRERKFESEDDKDWNLLANVGRFSFSGHDKQQLSLVQLADKLNRDPDFNFRLECCGRVTEQSYYHALQKFTSDRIVVRVDASEEDVERLLARAGVYVQTTGLHLARGQEPERCEHFGLALVEAMSHGCVPFAYGRGGPVEIISHGVNGFLFDSLEEFTEQLRTFQRLCASTKSRMQQAALDTATDYTHDAFNRTLGQLLASFGNPIHHEARP